DQVLGVGDDRGLLRVGLPLDAEELLLEGAAVVEGEDVELLVVSESHAGEYRKGASAGAGSHLEWAGMSPGADLFIVCKHCGSEVSPYITECPYCGHRLRKRAPKLPREGGSVRPRRGVLGRLGPRSSGEGEGEAPMPVRKPRRRRVPALTGALAARPYATIGVIVASCVVWVLLRAGYVAADKFVIAGPLNGDWWKLFSTQVSYLNGWYAFFTLLVIAIFGWLVERRYGPAVV